MMIWSHDDRAPYHVAPGKYRFGPLEFRRIDRLKEDFFSCNELLEDENGRIWVLKISRFLYVGSVANGPARFLSRREQRFYARLQGVQGIPELYPVVGANFLLHEFIPGDTLKVRKDVSDEFFDQLAELVRATHARGVASADLSKRANVIVGDDGRPYLIDFQISMGLVPPKGPLARASNAFTRHLMREDLYHVYKHKRYLRPDLLTPEEDEMSRRRSLPNKIHRNVIARPYLAVKRLIFPKGSHEQYLFWRPEEPPPGPDPGG